MTKGEQVEDYLKQKGGDQTKKMVPWKGLCFPFLMAKFFIIELS